MKYDSNDTLSMADYEIIMRREGYYIGYYGDSKIKNLIDDIKKKLNRHLDKAKGMSLILYHENSSVLIEFQKIIDELVSLVHKDADIILDYEIDDSLATGVIEYEILLTGLEQVR